MNLKKMLLLAVWVLSVVPCAFGSDAVIIELKYKSGFELFCQAQEASKGNLEPDLMDQNPDFVACDKYRNALSRFQSCYEVFSGGEKDFRPALMLAVTYAHLVALSDKLGASDGSKDKAEYLRLSDQFYADANRLFQEKYSQLFVGDYEGIHTFIGMADEDLNYRNRDVSWHFIQCNVNKEEFLNDFYFVYGRKTGHNQRNTFGVTLTVDVAMLRDSR